MPTLGNALRRLGRPPKGHAAPPLYDTVLTFSPSLSDSDAGVSATAASPADADEKFEFNARAFPAGQPRTMTLTVASVAALQVDFPEDYATAATVFRYTSKAGGTYTGVFAHGTTSTGL